MRRNTHQPNRGNMTNPSQILYLDTFSGISGDMFLGLLVDLGVDLNDIRKHLQTLEFPGWEISAHHEKRRGIQGRRIIIDIEEQHHHRTWGDIRTLIEKSRLDSGIRELALGIFQRIARAEAKIHGVTEDHVHFHEVGAMDSIIDIVGSAAGLFLLGNPRVVSSPLPFSAGTIHCEHGTFPLPAPATLEILQGLPLIDSGLRQELITPTGAAIAAEIAEFSPFPGMTIEKTGYGVGGKDIPEQPNLLRGILGSPLAETLESDHVTVMETHLDDTSSEWLGALMELLLENGALDVSFSPLQMKKNRPGVKVTIISEPFRVQTLSRLLLRESSAIGVRYHSVERLKLRRENRTFVSSLGEVSVKLVYEGGKLLRVTPEYECCRKIARERDIPLPEVYRIVNREADSLLEKSI
jgi:pyridinium-3,5-bisthiocarboxylic acid mononucleotide nickel chelatase